MPYKGSLNINMGCEVPVGPFVDIYPDSLKPLAQEEHTYFRCKYKCLYEYLFKSQMLDNLLLEPRQTSPRQHSSCSHR